MLRNSLTHVLGPSRAKRGGRVLLLGPLALAASLPVIGLLISSAPLAGRAGILALLVLTLIRPAGAVLVLAGLAPLGTVLGSMAGMPYSMTEPIVLTLLAGWLVREAAWPVSPVGATVRDVLVPVSLLALAAALSSVVLLAALQPFVAYPREFVGELAAFLFSDYFADRNRFAPLAAGLAFLEGPGLFAAAAVLLGRRREAAPALVRMTLVATVAIALLSVNRLLMLALRSGDFWQGLAHHATMTRITTSFPDVNAAGSYFAVGVTLAIAAAIGRRAWLVAACPLLVALWLTGSRAALLATAIAGALMAALAQGLRPPPRFRRTCQAAAIGLPILAAIALLSLSGNPKRWPMERATLGRVEFTRAAVGMIRDQPIFGVGVGRFKDSSSAYFSPAVRRYYASENAHNNFLQVFAELGLFGFIPLAWILVSVGWRLYVTLRRRPSGPAALGAAVGLFAFLVTCLGGHPLLIPEVKAAFWLLLGAALVLAAPAPGDDRGVVRPLETPLGWVLAVVVVVAIVSTPLRARRAVAASDLENAGIGFSSWESDEPGTAWRWIVAPRAQLYLPASAREVRLSFRVLDPQLRPDAEVVLYLDGHLANRVRLTPGTWVAVPMRMPDHAHGRFFRLEVEHEAPAMDAQSEDPERATIQMGRPVLLASPNSAAR